MPIIHGIQSGAATSSSGIKIFERKDEEDKLTNFIIYINII